MDEKVSYYEYCAPDGRVIATISIHGTPDMERIKKATARFLRNIRAEEERKRQAEAEA